MRKCLSLLLIVILIFSLSACQSNSESSPDIPEDWTKDYFDDLSYSVDLTWEKKNYDEDSAHFIHYDILGDNNKLYYTITVSDASYYSTYEEMVTQIKEADGEKPDNNSPKITNVKEWSNGIVDGYIYEAEDDDVDENDDIIPKNSANNRTLSKQLILDHNEIPYTFSCIVYNLEFKDDAFDQFKTVISSINLE